MYLGLALPLQVLPQHLQQPVAVDGNVSLCKKRLVQATSAVDTSPVTRHGTGTIKAKTTHFLKSDAPRLQKIRNITSDSFKISLFSLYDTKKVFYWLVLCSSSLKATSALLFAIIE